jgi:hypothetical protein
MARHMLVEFPLVFGLGVVLAHRAPRRIDAAIARIDALGLTGWLFAVLVAAFWMIPAALDLAVANALVNAAKLASLAAAGFLLHGAMRRSPRALEAFFVGNFTWMTATVGLVYQEAESRLCLAYLVDAQQRAGSGLVVLAVAVLVAWFATRGYIFSSASARSQPAPGDTARKASMRAR